MTWNPDQYDLFKAARTAPAHDLQAMIPDQAFGQIVDLGCGTGEQTVWLAQRFPGAQVLGIDSSAEMLAKTELTRAKSGAIANLSFKQQDIEQLQGQYDLMYSNAALQWLPDHQRLLPRIWSHLAPGGVLAVQVPANHDHASHRLLTETAQEFSEELGGFTRFGPGKSPAPTAQATTTAYGQSPVLTPAAYAELLDSLGGQNITAISKVYPVVLGGAEGIIEWTKGTALVPYLARLTDRDATRFLETYLNKLKAVFPGKRVYYAFTRVLFVATRPES